MRLPSKSSFFYILSILLVICVLGYAGMLLLPDDATTTKLHSLNGKLQDGDIIFHTSTSHQSKAIQIATDSEYSHMGIIYRQKGELYVFEAVQKVKLTKLSDWIRRGENQKYVVKRIKNAKELINYESLSRMKKAGERFLDKKYDLYFEWTDENIYCSELVWKIYKEALNIEIGQLQELKDFNLENPEVSAILKERYGNKIPFSEKVISPVTMFKSTLLEDVVRN